MTNEINIRLKPDESKGWTKELKLEDIYDGIVTNLTTPIELTNKNDTSSSGNGGVTSDTGNTGGTTTTTDTTAKIETNGISTYYQYSSSQKSLTVGIISYSSEDKESYTYTHSSFSNYVNGLPWTDKISTNVNFTNKKVEMMNADKNDKFSEVKVTEFSASGGYEFQEGLEEIIFKLHTRGGWEKENNTTKP